MGRRKFRPLNGILLLDKALGVSSNKALQDARFLFAAEKAGHTGSLDPLATGMLPICFGEATKVSAFLLDSDKRYITTASLGYVSTTGDAEGEKINPRPVPHLTDTALESVLDKFRGNISQIPPMYSALKKEGQPLYKLARQGVEVEREARNVVIHSLQVLARTDDTLTLDVVCSKGTYIRSLVEDIGESIGCGAYVARLHREFVMPFGGQKMYTLEELRNVAEQGMDALDQLLLPMDQALPDVPSMTLDDGQITRLRQGQRLFFPGQMDSELIKIYSTAHEFVGLACVQTQVLMVKRLLAC
ncbi:MAG TPA: tRNA pseudouridine(55) synthase TruB [Candidatus Thiothrix moscowensis]|uniref:tRNA pseudouridine(55) synthase TruB n=1 Tax=unclassified Thiothrix TaxID=2636184 RepID=UPI0025FD2A4D|nr:MULTISPECIES: tRNA pseudouridine(55) synthase TruB [unclassified Thiothrix]HRJ53370.1 tRNA pseudouridine(55) synthase TruB [Candidatus Thiothrix moscowensis]HRJ94653.1 tRNA pseudouridine(55) synthase TruB [Candidatus Thiothrix moscowensis]